MVAVAIVALSIAAEQMRRKSTRYRERAERHANIEHAHRELAALLPPLRSSAWLAAYHAELRRKYEHAARYPWLPVEPDTPEPE
jgi:hypothetical protein